MSLRMRRGAFEMIHDRCAHNSFDIRRMTDPRRMQVLRAGLKTSVMHAVHTENMFHIRKPDPAQTPTYVPATPTTDPPIYPIDLASLRPVSFRMRIPSCNTRSVALACAGLMPCI
eukprot:6203674-Pleurochrysis_carterae.AAC.1